MSSPVDEHERERLRALIEAQHDFPGPYTFKVIFRNDPGAALTILEALRAGASRPVPIDAEQMRTSSGGKFGSMSFDLDVGSAEDVLDIYRVLAEIEGIVSYF